MAERHARSAYLLETAKGTIELSKGMYLSLIRRRALVGKDTKKKMRENCEDHNKTAIKSRPNINLRKTILKGRTTKKPETILQQRNILYKGNSVSLRKGILRKKFEIYEDSRLFPGEIQQFQVSMS
jgi:hypothetical protein